MAKRSQGLGPEPPQPGPPRFGTWMLDFGAQKWSLFSKLSLMVWSWEAWGWVRVGVGQVLTNVLHVLAKGFPINYLKWAR